LVRERSEQTEIGDLITRIDQCSKADIAQEAPVEATPMEVESEPDIALPQAQTAPEQGPVEATSVEVESEPDIALPQALAAPEQGPVEAISVEVEAEPVISLPEVQTAPEEAPPVIASSEIVTPSVDELLAAVPLPDEVMAPEIVYEEIYDKELFAIFRKQLDEGLMSLSADTDQLVSGHDAHTVLVRCKDTLRRMRSSANYMDYSGLTVLYDQWIGSIDAARERLAAGDPMDLEAWSQAVMRSHMTRIREFFPGPAPEVHYPPPEELPPVEQPPQDIEVVPAEIGQTEIGSIEATPPESVVSEIVPPTLQPTGQAVSMPLPLDALDAALAGEDITLSSLLAESQDEATLLSQLESAFDSKIEETMKTDFVAHSTLDVVQQLLSTDEVFEPPPRPLAQMEPQRRSPDQRVAEDSREIESFLFSEGQPQREPRTVVAPKPLAEFAERAEGALFSFEDEERSRKQHPGRRQTDKFRDRIAKQSIRVDANKIDTLLNQVGELVVTRAGFSQLFLEMRELQSLLKQAQRLDVKEMQLVKDLTARINSATVALSRITSELQENVMKVRMLPIAQLFSRYPRVVHDLVRNSSKKVDLEIRGEETELDRMVIEQIADPLVHIIRNAVDHGIEAPEERQRKGKPETGILRMDAYHEGNNVVIEISDDGRGLDVEKIKVKAVEKGFVQPEELKMMTEDQILALIMRPGFSTADEVTHTSGRGVGMDVVKDNLDRLNGTIETQTTPGRGTLFKIKIPLTLAIIPALLVRVADDIFTIPLAAVDETLRIHHNEISTIEGVEIYYLREATLPLIRMANVFKMKSAPVSPQELFVVVVNTGNRKVGLIVDQLRGREEVVIKPLEDYLQEKSGFSGATILGDGAISLIIDVADLVQLAVEQHVRRAQAAAV
jgi:two-component system chemotaxis sensor kinase CheA